MGRYGTPTTPAALRFAAAAEAFRQTNPGAVYRYGGGAGDTGFGPPGGWQPNPITHTGPGGIRFIGPPIPRGNSVNKHTYALMQWLRG